MRFSTKPACQLAEGDIIRLYDQWELVQSVRQRGPLDMVNVRIVSDEAVRELPPLQNVIVLVENKR